MAEPNTPGGQSQGSVQLKLIRMEEEGTLEDSSKKTNSMKESSDSVSEEDNYSLASSYDAQVAYDNAPEEEKPLKLNAIHQARIKKMEKKGKMKKSTANFAPILEGLKALDPKPQDESKQNILKTEDEAKQQKEVPQKKSSVNNFPRRSEFSKVVSQKEINVLQEIKHHTEYRNDPQKLTSTMSFGFANQSKSGTEQREKELFDPSFPKKMQVQRGFSFGKFLYVPKIKPGGQSSPKTSSGDASPSRKQSQLSNSLEKVIDQDLKSSNQEEDSVSMNKSKEYEYQSDLQDEEVEQSDSSSENDASSFSGITDSAMSQTLISHRVDTVSNISHISRLNKSGYSARFMLNKSMVSADRRSETSSASKVATEFSGFVKKIRKSRDDRSVEDSSEFNSQPSEFKVHETIEEEKDPPLREPNLESQIEGERAGGDRKRENSLGIKSYLRAANRLRSGSKHRIGQDQQSERPSTTKNNLIKPMLFNLGNMARSPGENSPQSNHFSRTVNLRQFMSETKKSRANSRTSLSRLNSLHLSKKSKLSSKNAYNYVLSAAGSQSGSIQRELDVVDRAALVDPHQLSKISDNLSKLCASLCSSDDDERNEENTNALAQPAEQKSIEMKEILPVKDRRRPVVSSAIIQKKSEPKDSPTSHNEPAVPSTLAVSLPRQRVQRRTRENRH